jgi:hypothetical protein
MAPTLPTTSRTTDPETSRLAAKAIYNRETIMKRIDAICQASPGLTSGEIWEHHLPDLTFASVWKRLSDLKSTGQVVPGSPRRWSGSGRLQATWWPPDHQIGLW